MKKLLIVTGPQGSGNHLFARLFSAHPNVKGWESLHDKYWVPSDEEPFARYWVHPEELKKEFFEDGSIAKSRTKDNSDGLGRLGMALCTYAGSFHAGAKAIGKKILELTEGAMEAEAVKEAKQKLSKAGLHDRCRMCGDQPGERRRTIRPSG